MVEISAGELRPARTWRWEQVARSLAWAVWTSAVVFIAVAGVLILGTWSVDLPARGFGFRGWVPLVALMWATIGARIAARQPRNAVGWLILACGWLWATTTMFEEYATFAYFPQDIGLPFVPALIWFNGLTPTFVAGCSALALLLLPDGRLPSRRWSVIAMAIVVASLAGTAVYAFVPRRLVPFPFANPLGLGGLDADDRALSSLFDAVYVLRGLVVLVPTAALLVRLRDATGDRRQQLKWVGSAATLASVMFFLNAVIRGNAVIQLAEIVTLVLVPVAFGIAMRRFRLYDIDRVLNGAIVYGGATALLTGAYIAAIGTMQRLFLTLTGERSDAAIILTTLLIAAAFTPLKDRLQALVDARFKFALPGTEGLATFTAELDQHLTMSDRARLLTRLLDEAIVSLGAVGGGLRSANETVPRVTRRLGRWSGTVELTVTVRDRDGAAAEVFLGPRINGEQYSEHHRAQLRRAAELVGASLERVSP